MAGLRELEEERKKKINPNDTFDVNGSKVELDKTSFLSRFMDRNKERAAYRSTIKDPNKAFSADVPENTSTIRTTKLNQLPNKTPFEDRAANNLLYSENQPVLPRIKEVQNDQRDAELGKMEANINDAGNAVYSIGGNTMEVLPNSSNQVEQPRQGNSNSFRRGNLDIQFDDSVDQASRERFLENPVRPTAQIDRYNQRQAQQGDLSQGQLASANASKIINPPKNGPARGWKAQMAIDEQNLKNEQSDANNERTNLANLRANEITNNTRRSMDTNTNAIASERNDILRENNTLQSMIKPKRASKVVKRYDPLLGKVIGEDIVRQNEDGSWPEQQTDQQFKTPTAATKRKMLSMRNSKDRAKYEEQYIKDFGRLPY